MKEGKRKERKHAWKMDGRTKGWMNGRKNDARKDTGRGEENG